MSIYVYLDHNIIDDISKGDFSLKPSNGVVWVYSHENLGEIRRSNNKIFLDVLEDIQARKLELLLDSKFRVTGEAKILEYRSPHDIYVSYLEAVSENEIDDESNLEFMARLFGAENKDKVLSHPKSFEENIRSLLEPHGLYDENTRIKVEQVRNELVEFVNGPMQEIGKLEKARESFGTSNGRAGNLAEKENPIEELWNIIKNGIPGITANQYFGFDPIEKQGYDVWPMYLGIVGCHAVLNILGFRPDDGLTKPENIPGILSDGSHIGHAAYCQALLSRDRKLLAKARAIYKYKGIATTVLSYERKRG